MATKEGLHYSVDLATASWEVQHSFSVCIVVFVQFLVELVHDPKSNLVEDWRSKFNQVCQCFRYGKQECNYFRVICLLLLLSAQVALAFEMKDLKQLLEVSYYTGDNLAMCL